MRSIITFFCLATSFAAWGDTIYLKSGARIVADSAQERNGRVEYTIGGNLFAIPKSHVIKIESGAGFVPDRPSKAALADIPPVHSELPAANNLLALVIRDGKVDDAALRAIESEGIPDKSAVANSIAADFKQRQNDLPSAAHYLEVALTFKPNHVVLLENYAALLLQLDRSADALSYALHATEVSPQSGEAFTLLGFAYYKNDRNREAIAALKKSLQLRPNDKTQELLDRVERESKAEAEFREQGSDHFVLRYEGSQTPDALRRQILDVLESQYRDLESDLGASPKNIFVSLYTDQAFFDVTQAPSWSTALNDGKIRIPISGLVGVTPSLARVLRHELTHSFIAHITHNRAPQWLNEGIAVVEEGTTTASVGRNLARLYASGNQIPLNQLEGDFTQYSSGEASVAYAEALAAAEYIRSNYGMGDIARILHDLGEGQSVETALRGSIRIGYAQLETEITDYLKRKYGS